MESWQGTAFDLVIDRADHVINLCEMKFSKTKFSISLEYETTLRERIRLFAESSKTNKSLACTFVTTYGVADGVHHGIVDCEITADDLYM